jgi:hypothetical protein
MKEKLINIKNIKKNLELLINDENKNKQNSFEYR